MLDKLNTVRTVSLLVIGGRLVRFEDYDHFNFKKGAKEGGEGVAWCGKLTSFLAIEVWFKPIDNISSQTAHAFCRTILTHQFSPGFVISPRDVP